MSIDDVRQPGGITRGARRLTRGNRTLRELRATPQFLVKLRAERKRRFVSDRPERSDEHGGTGAQERLCKAADAGQLVAGASCLTRVEEDDRLDAIRSLQAGEVVDGRGVDVSRD